MESIQSPEDVKILTDPELAQLCGELREFLVSSVSKTGGHLASNLGVVELTVALHRIFDTSRDRIVFDVGHQCYVHKLLTGRAGEFDALRRFGGLAGFPKPAESAHDAFIAGHASNSVSVALGMARAAALESEDYSVIAVIGDGALTGGLAYEGLSDAGESGVPLIVILNDNGMSITESVGGMARYLSRQRVKPSYLRFKKRYRAFTETAFGGKLLYKFTHAVKNLIKRVFLNSSIFENLGFQYIGVLDGHNVAQLETALDWARSLHAPVLVHVSTKKGLGYKFSEETPDLYHGVPPFNPEVGITEAAKESFSSVFGSEMCWLAEESDRVCAVTAAMTSGTGLANFAARFPKRFFDVGIAEGHAVAMAAGLAEQGITPVVAMYSTFLQRAYDMLVHDVSIMNLHVVFAVDRAGIVPGDGETHQGIYDVAYLSSVPGMTVMCPASHAELRDMLRLAVKRATGPVALRYPKGGEGDYREGGVKLSKVVREGEDVTIVTYGVLVNVALEAAEVLARADVSVEVVKLGVINPIEFATIERSVGKTRRLLVLEDCVAAGCVGERILAHLEQRGIETIWAVLKNTGSRSIPCGTVDELRRMCGIDEMSVAVAITEKLRPELADEKNPT
ncbi:MAG: 1-deoxy-D-xylulose-5-phosphate synthase [Oscillospiraceae bacterium]|nr:1-deoxy-D-xylulose-5-phosphate synthase [Oscillospiraceae bacterium]